MSATQIFPAGKPNFVPVLARTLTMHTVSAPVAYDCVKLIVVRSGSAIVFSELVEKPMNVGYVVLLGPNTLCGSEPEGWVTTTTLHLDTDYVVDQVFWQNASILANRLATGSGTPGSPGWPTPGFPCRSSRRSSVTPRSRSLAATSTLMTGISPPPNRPTPSSPTRENVVRPATTTHTPARHMTRHATGTAPARILVPLSTVPGAPDRKLSTDRLRAAIEHAPENLPDDDAQPPQIPGKSREKTPQPRSMLGGHPRSADALQVVGLLPAPVARNQAKLTLRLKRAPETAGAHCKTTYTQ